MNKRNYKKQSKNVYKLPFNEKLNLKPRPAPKHYKSMINALDFPMPEGTPIYAALEGIIIKLKKDSNTGGPDESLRKQGNFILIQHDHNEYTQYVHLRYNGVIVKEKQKVKQEEVIGYSGDTGFTTYPHLHFAVLKYLENKKLTHLIPRFKIKNKITTLTSPKK